MIGRMKTEDDFEALARYHRVGADYYVAQKAPEAARDALRMAAQWSRKLADLRATRAAKVIEFPGPAEEPNRWE